MTPKLIIDKTRVFAQVVGNIVFIYVLDLIRLKLATISIMIHAWVESNKNVNISNLRYVGWQQTS